MFRLRSLRLRIALTFIVGTLVVSGLVAGTTYYLVLRQLTAESIDAAARQTYSKLRTTVELIQSSRNAVTAADVRDLLQQRGDLVVIGRGNVAKASSPRFDVEAIPEGLKASVADGNVAYSFTSDGPRTLIIGSLIPGTNEQGQVYFAYPFSNVDRTLALLRKIFLAVIGAAALAAGAVGMRLAVATIRPLRAAADAARRVAEGNLETRLDMRGEDELARLAASFNRMTEALEERIARERRFVADVSHELRTPLTGLKTSIDFLASREDLPERLKSATTLASEEVRSLQRLVDDLLELSRVEAGGLLIEQEEVDLMNFANELTRRRAPAADVTVAGPDQLVVWTDKMRLERVVGNVLENAVFHGGAARVEIEIGQDDGFAHIAVTDRGPGIDPALLPHIFDRFWRGDSSRRRDGRIGAGLGLAIARENAAAIGAEIDVASSPGVGTRFEVRVPVGTR